MDPLSNAPIPNKKLNWLFVAAIIAMFAGAIFVSIIYVACHFIAKVW